MVDYREPGTGATMLAQSCPDGRGRLDAVLRPYFSHSVWLSTVSQADWERTYSVYTIVRVREVFPMGERTVDGLTAAARTLLVRR